MTAKKKRRKAAAAPRPRSESKDARRCGACGHGIRQTARFCDRCGAAATGQSSAPHVAAAELRSVTVLFADLQGFTTLSERLEPDEVHELMQRVFGATDRCVEELGGSVEAHVGDAVMALFGAPRARDDDPARAIRCGLRIQERLRELSESLEADGYPSVALRVGINTGRVALGAVRAEGEGASVWGDAVNVASRLQTVCPSGGVLVSHETYRRVRGMFEVEPQPAMPVKGKRLPLVTYLVVKEKGEQSFIGTRDVLGQETHMVGRDRELTLLMDIYNRCVERRRATIVTIIGSPGIGKSRLLHEYLKRIEASPRRVFLMRSRASLETANDPYHLVATMVKLSAGIHESHTAEEARTRLLAWVATRLAPRRGGRRAYDPAAAPQPFGRGYPEEAAHFLGELLGMPYTGSRHVATAGGDQMQVRQRAHLALERVLLRGASQAPLVIELEDIQWADNSSLELFEHLRGALEELPFLVLAAARPELMERNGGWVAPGPFRAVIHLEALGPAQARELLEHLLRSVEGNTEELARDLAERSGGTPYFAEEIVKSLADVGALVPVDAGFRVDAGAVQRLAMPPSVEGVLQERLDRLTTHAQAIARIAAVVGRNFWDRTLVDLCALRELRRLVPHVPRADDVGAALEELRAREIVRSQPTTSFPPFQELAFVHDLMRDVVYGTLVKRVRARIHLTVARWLEQHAGDRSREWLGIIAGHYEAGNDGPMAARHYMDAGTAAADIYSNREAIRFFERAIAVVERRGECAVDERLSCATVRQRIGDWQRAIDDLEHAETGAVARVAHPQLARILVARATIETLQGRFDRGLALARRAADAARDCAAPAELALALSAQASVHGRRGDRGAARALREEALEVRRQLGDQRGVADGLVEIASSRLAAEDSAGAFECFEQALTILRALGDRGRIAAVLHSQALGRQEAGDHKAALALYAESLDMRRSIGDRPHMAWNLHNLASIHQARGEWDRAHALNEESIAICRSVGNRPGVAYGLANRGGLLAAQGSLDEARAVIEEALQIFGDVGELPQIAAAMESLGEVLVGLGCYRRALEQQRRALELRAELGRDAAWGEVRVALAGTLARVGALPDAWRTMNDAWRVIDQGGTVTTRCRTLLALARLGLLLGKHEVVRELSSQASALAAGMGVSSLALSAQLVAARIDGSLDGIATLLASVRALGDRSLSAMAAVDAGELLAVAPAQIAARQALSGLVEDVVDLGCRMHARHLLARLDEAAGDREAARGHLEGALADLRALRPNVPSEYVGAFNRHPWVSPLATPG